MNDWPTEKELKDYQEMEKDPLRAIIRATAGSMSVSVLSVVSQVASHSCPRAAAAISSRFATAVVIAHSDGASPRTIKALTATADVAATASRIAAASSNDKRGVKRAFASGICGKDSDSDDSDSDDSDSEDSDSEDSASDDNCKRLRKFQHPV